MKRQLAYVGALLGSFSLGVALAPNWHSAFDLRASERPKPAYLVSSWDVLRPDQLRAFGDAVIPLAKKAGWEPLAASEPVVLEGNWPKVFCTCKGTPQWKRC
jgi:hypothetical protein